MTPDTFVPHATSDYFVANCLTVRFGAGMQLEEAVDTLGGNSCDNCSTLDLLGLLLKV